jgi:hypothetical protein
MKIVFQNRLNQNVELQLLEPRKWLLRIEEPNDVELFVSSYSVGPHRGPHIFVGDPLSYYNKILPDNRVTKISYEPYAVDPSGYEYFGAVIYTD